MVKIRERARKEERRNIWNIEPVSKTKLLPILTSGTGLLHSPITALIL
jgi:hypothetical protein